MITPIIYIDGDPHIVRADGDSERQTQYFGLSTDTKPVTNVLNAEIFYEMDTKKAFLFDESNKKWLEQ